MSLSEGLLEEIDSARKSTGFSGRSEVIRSAMKLLIDDLREKEKLSGHTESVLMFVHSKKFENAFTGTIHKHESIITTQVHNNICNNKCLEVFVLHGEAEKIREFFSEVRTNKRTEYAKLIVP